MSEPDNLRHGHRGERSEQMISVDDALAHILSAFRPLPAKETPLLDALGLVLVDDVIASRDLPPFSNSAMDGYVVRAADTMTATPGRPRRLRVVDQVAAGRPSDREIREGEAARIMTGAPLPAGADAVIRFEEVEAGAWSPTETTFIQVDRPVNAGADIRPAGEDVASGTVALRAGTVLRPPEIGMLAALGRISARVHRRPLVAVLSTGDELMAAGTVAGPGKIYDSNSVMIAAMAIEAGADVFSAGIARDAVQDVASHLSRCHDADLIVTTGGVSHGDFDVVKDALQAEGEIALWQVRMRPGKPLAFGSVGSTPLLGLPGNPVAAAVAFSIFALPAIQRMTGKEATGLRTLTATLTTRIENPGGRRHFVRAIVEPCERGEWCARPAEKQGSGILSSLTAANGLLDIPEDVDVVWPGTRVAVRLFNQSDTAQLTQARSGASVRVGETSLESST